MGRVRKGLTYLGTEVGESGSAGAVARVRRVCGCSERRWRGLELTVEWRLDGCTAGFEIWDLADPEGTAVADERMSEKKDLNFEAGVLGRSGILMLWFLGTIGVLGATGE